MGIRLDGVWQYGKVICKRRIIHGEFDFQQFYILFCLNPMNNARYGNDEIATGGSIGPVVYEKAAFAFWYVIQMKIFVSMRFDADIRRKF
ncbi:MAG: hypothetical protein PHO15_04540 [Eubacteriales bacterium]|nr:hypothetical protein [Eubacteriales bacterium]